MKKLLFFLAAIFPLACTRIQMPSDSNLPTEIDFSVQMGSFATKATDTAFENGDEMNLLVMWGDESMDIRKASYNNGKISLDRNLYWPEKPGWEEANFVMLYPYMEGYTEENIAEFIYGGEVLFTVNADQSTHALYTSSDLIAGGCYELQETDAPCTVKMTLAHILSQVRIVITNKSEFGIKDVYLSDVYGKFDLNSGKLSGSKGMIKACNSGNGQWTCIVPPQTGKPVIHITTTDNREIVFKAPSEIELPQSVRTNLLLTLNDNAEASDFSYEIVNWDPGHDFNFTQNEWESLGTGWIRDLFFGEDFFPVEIERKKENPRHFRLVNPYSGIKQEYDPTSSATPDNYLYFRIFDKGEIFANEKITRDNFVGFSDFASGCTEEQLGSIILYHPYRFVGYDFPDWKKNRVVWFQDDGTPGQVNLSPFYLNSDNIGYVWCKFDDCVAIIFPNCDYRTYEGTVLRKDYGYGAGIKKDGGKVFLSFEIKKIDPEVSSIRFAILDKDIEDVNYSDIIEMEDGLIDSQTVTEDSKEFLIEIQDDGNPHCVLYETYGDGYPQYEYVVMFKDSGAATKSTVGATCQSDKELRQFTLRKCK